MAATHMGAGELSLKDKRRAFKAVQKMHDRQMALLETKVMEAFGVDPSDAIYQSSRYYTRLGLEVYSIAAGGYGAVKGVMALRKLAKASSLSYLASKHLPIKRFGASVIAKESEVLANSGLKNFCKIDAVIEKTLNGSIHSQYKVSASEALESGMKFLGANYKELGKSGSGVFRSTDQLRGFRIDNNSLQGLHSPGVPHYHLEVFQPNSNKPYISNHIPFYEK